MYDFQDYFDVEKSDQPYTAPGEELEDYLRLLDMLLENYLEHKSMGNHTKLFSRGLVVTESEMRSYFEMPPYFRDRDVWDPVLSASVDAAFNYIDKRTLLTQDKLKRRKKKTAQDDPEKKKLLRIFSMTESFTLNRTELFAVLLALTVEIDRRYERIMGFLQDDITRSIPTIGLLYTLMSRITPRNGSEEAIPLPLDEKMYTYFFIKKETSGNLSCGLVLHPLMKELLMGTDLPEEVDSAPFRLFEEQKTIPPFFEKSYRELEGVENQQTGSSGNMIYLANEDEETVLHIIYKYCADRQKKLYVLDLRQLAEMSAEKRRLSLSELFIRVKLSHAQLAVRYIPEDLPDSVRVQGTEQQKLLNTIRKVCSQQTVCIFGEKEEPVELAAGYVPLLRVPDAPVDLRTKVWEFFLTENEGIKISPDVNIPDLADCYEIPYGKIRKVIGHAIATARVRQDTEIDRDLILESLKQMNRVDFSGLATYVNPAYTWKDITITDSQRAVMQTACDRYRLRNRIGESWGLKRKNAYGNGVSILLFGPPGTGKTMAAQVIANELTLPLYRVDISQISSKYIGETEKNLAAIFNAAAKANVILFFDEADALFSKRTSVGDSHDKYANSETAFLLQKIEEYDGMSILSTNYYNNFDDAFVRRITYSIHLQQPDKATRLTLWKTILPDTAKVSDDIDYKFLADKFDLSGSNIKAILFNAAYIAGAEKSEIGMKHIVRAMEYEFTKLGKLVNTSDFGKYDIYLEEKQEKEKEKVTSTFCG